MKKSITAILVFSMFISFNLYGQTWSRLIRLTWNRGNSCLPALATDLSSRIHVIWEDDSLGNEDIFYKNSTNDGATWTGLIRITWNSGISSWPSIATDSGNGVHVVWNDDTPGNKEIYYKHSTDSGSNWSGLNRLTWNNSASIWPSIAADSGSGIHVVWVDDIWSNCEILYKNSTDGGNTWSGITRMTWNSGVSSWPSIATDSGNGVHIVWEDDTPGTTDIFYRHSTDSGATWSGLTRLTWNGAFNSSLAVGPGSAIHVVWENYSLGNNEIFYRRSSDGGSSWSRVTRLTWNIGCSSVPSITTDSGSGIHVVWQDDTPGWLLDEIFYKLSPDGGITWSGITRLTWNSGISSWPSIAADSGSGVHVVWEDDATGNTEIFYKNRK